jgi:hypothetical protein
MILSKKTEKNREFLKKKIRTLFLTTKLTQTKMNDVFQFHFLRNLFKKRNLIKIQRVRIKTNLTLSNYLACAF